MWEIIDDDYDVVDREDHSLRAQRTEDPGGCGDKVAASIQEFGWRQPIVVDGKGVIICGHTRLLAARKLGLPQAPCMSSRI